MMKMNSDERKNAAELDLSIAQITTGAHGDDEQLRAFHRAIQTGVDLPCDAFVNQGVRFLINDVRVGTPWEDRREKR
jgi:hypothetical protein